MKRNKKIRLAVQIMCLVLVAGIWFQGSIPAVQVKAAQTVKIMPLGDSITDCDFWRTRLFTKLEENGFEVQSVGTRQGGHEGHSGMLVTDSAKTAQLTGWLSKSNPDMVMMLFGTNDCWCDKGAKAILSAYTTLVGQMRENNPKMVIVIGKVTPLIPNFTSDFVYRAEELALAMEGWAEELSTKESPIYVVDQFTGFDAMTDTYDGVHPNEKGSVKMCDKWYASLSQILTGTGPAISEIPEVSEVPEASKIPEVSEVPEVSKIPEISEVPEASNQPVPTGSGFLTSSSGVSAGLDVNTWDSGFTAIVKVSNSSETEAVTNWHIEIPKKDFKLTNCWCANVEETEDIYIFTPMSWNATIPAGQSTSFGFQGEGRLDKFS